MINYFGLLEIPEKLLPDLEQVRKSYFALSKKFHPDFHIHESVGKQAEILQKSTEINKAWQTVSDPLKRLEHLLELRNLLENSTLPPDFLMEMMELNEQVEALGNDSTAEQVQPVRSALESEKSSLNEQMDILFKKHDAASSTEEQNSILRELNVLRMKNKYLLRLQQSLDTFAS